MSFRTLTGTKILLLTLFLHGTYREEEEEFLGKERLATPSEGNFFAFRRLFYTNRVDSTARSSRSWMKFLLFCLSSSHRGGVFIDGHFVDVSLYYVSVFPVSWHFWHNREPGNVTSQGDLCRLQNISLLTRSDRNWTTSSFYALIVQKALGVQGKPNYGEVTP